MLRVDKIDMSTESFEAEVIFKTNHDFSSMKKTRILHFNDVYNIDKREREPVGGASRFATVLEELSKEGVPSLVFFSGK